MSVEITVEDEKLVILSISGTYLFSEFIELEKQFEKILTSHTELDLLVIFTRFTGWEDCELWAETAEDDGLATDVIKKVALVADRKWHDQIAMFGLLGFQQWPSKFFSETQIADAYHWLES